MTPRDIVKAQLNHQTTEITPYTCGCEPLLHQKITDFYADPKWREHKLVEFMDWKFYIDTLIMKPVNDERLEKFPNLKDKELIAAKYNDDIYSVDAFGTVWRLDKKPFHQERPGLIEPTFDGYTFPSVDEFIENSANLKAETITQYADKNNDLFRLINIGWGVFEHTWCLRGFEDTMVDMLTEEKFYFELCEKLTDLMVDIVRSTSDIEADAVFFGDDWGDQRGIIMGRDLFVKYFKPCYERIYDEVHKQGRKVIQHCCGSIVDIYKDLADIGMDCHESVQPEAANMNPKYLRDTFSKDMCFFGCLGSQSTLYSGTPDEIKEQILYLRDLFKDTGGYILAPAKVLSDEMSLDQALAVVETLYTLND